MNRVSFNMRNYHWFEDPTALLIAMFLAAFLVPPKAQAAEWDTTEKVMFGTFVALQVVDTTQTWKIHDNQDKWKEVNPLFGEDPNMGVVIGAKVLGTGLVYWLVKDMPNSDRKLILGVVNALQVSVVANNYSIGLKLGF